MAKKTTTPQTAVPVRRLPVGAEVAPGGVHVRVWAPRRERVEVVFEEASEEWPVDFELSSEGEGYFSGLVPGAGAGALYRLRLDGGDAYPDPASRFQPEGPHGPSQVVDCSTFPWSDTGWPGVGRDGQVVYEMHLGTFTREGTWEAASRELPELADLGITIVEVMPVAEFPGRFGWGTTASACSPPTTSMGSRTTSAASSTAPTPRASR